MKKLLIIILGILTVGTTVVFAAPYYTNQRSLLPIDSTENVGTTTNPWDVGFFNQLCLSADCKTAWPSGASLSGGINNTLTYWTSATAVSATNSPTVGFIIATSTTSSVLPYASTTALTSTGSAYFATAGGNFGIGTTSPASLLSLQGNALFSGNLTLANLTATGTATIVGDSVIGDYSTPLASGLTISNTGPHLYFRRSNGSVDNKNFDFIESGTVLTIRALNDANSIGTNAISITRSGNSITKTTFDNGNVGVGTTTPGSLFSVNGITNFTTATSSFYGTGGINLNGGCFAINGTCVSGGGSGTGTVNSGGATQIAWYASDGTTVSGTSTNPLTVGRLLATSTVASNLRYASSTALSVSGTGYLGSGVITNGLIINGTSNSGTVAVAAPLFTATGNDVTGADFKISCFGDDPGVGYYGKPFCWTWDVAGVRAYIDDGNGNPLGLRANTLTATGNVNSTNANISTVGGYLYQTTGGSNIIGTTSPTANYFTATSTQKSIFPYASTTAFTSTGSAYFATLGGNVGIGTTTPVAKLGFDTTTTAAGGINFGDATANLYRSSGGTIKTDGGLTVAGGTITGGTATSPGLKLQSSLSSASIQFQAAANAAMTYTSGTGEIFMVGSNSTTHFTPTSGSGVHNIFEVQGALNQTGNSSGITRGIYVNPILTSVRDFRGLEIAPYTMNVNLTGLSTTTGFVQHAYTVASTTAATVTNAYQQYISGAPIASTNVTISTSTALLINGLTSVVNGGTVTTAYGLQVFAPTGATNNYGAIIMNGNVGIGTTSPWRGFDVNGTVGMKGLTTSSGLQSGVLCISATNEVINDSVACLASAARFKMNIKPLNQGMSEIMRLKPVSFYYKPEFNGMFQNNPNYNGEQIGFIADDAQKVDDRLVTVAVSGKDKGMVESFRYENVTALIVKAIQEQEIKIESIKSTMGENWQWVFVSFLIMGMAYQQIQINKLKK